MVRNASSKKIVHDRAHGRCEYCHMVETPSNAPFHLEHIVALYHKGQSRQANLALACARCNHYKGPNLSGIDPATGRVTTLFHPRRDNWRQHFCRELETVIGLTPKGRATVETLRMNAPERRAARAALIRRGRMAPFDPPR